MIEKIVEQILAIEPHFSDIQLSINKRPAFRQINRFNELEDHEPLTKETIERIFNEIVSLTATPERVLRVFKENNFVDFSFAISGERFRASVYYSLGSIAISLRRLRQYAITFEELHIDPVIKDYLGNRGGGLYLVTGKAAQGKTTTAVAMLQYIIKHEKGLHIITVEDPVEYLIDPGDCFVDQREIGTDILDYEKSMVSIVRENPDIVFLGEIRDRIAAEVAILLASTGHMVLATFHSAPITAVFERYKSMISPDNVPLFASSIELVVTQYLQNYNGIFFPVFEIVERSPAIQTLITENRLQELYNYKGNGVVLTREESIKRQELIIKSEIIKRKASEFEKFITR